jgi:hypothetical protein
MPCYKLMGNGRVINTGINTIPEAAKISKATALMQLCGPQRKDKQIMKNYLTKLKRMKKQVREFDTDCWW